MRIKSGYHQVKEIIEGLLERVSGTTKNKKRGWRSRHGEVKERKSMGAGIKST